MLSLGRESGEYIVINGNIVIQVVEVGNQLRLAIDAPREIPIVRGEYWEKDHAIPDCIRKSREQKEPPKSFDFNRLSVKACGKTDGIK